MLYIFEYEKNIISEFIYLYIKLYTPFYCQQNWYVFSFNIFVIYLDSPTQSPTPTDTPHYTSATHQSTPFPVTPKQTQAPHSGTGTANAKHGAKFIMELNEPGKELPNQTRKFLLYFTQPVTPNFNQAENTISFNPTSGGKYNGIMQLAYLGAGPRGDMSHNNDLDDNLGVYSYRPTTSYCVSEEVNKTFVSFDWNIDNQYADKPMGELIMVTMPHHVSRNLNIMADNNVDT